MSMWGGGLSSNSGQPTCRNPLSPPNRQALHLLQKSQFQVNEEVHSFVFNLFSMVGQSKICEDGMHFERRGEGACDAKIMSAERRWRTLVEAHILTREHGYDEIDWSSGSIPRGVPQAQLKGLISENRADASLNFKSIVGFGRPNYHSQSPELELRAVSDIYLAMRCKQDNSWSRAQTSWLACLARVPRLCVTHPTLQGKWFFLLGDVAGTAFLAWLAAIVGDIPGDAKPIRAATNGNAIDAGCGVGGIILDLRMAPGSGGSFGLSWGDL